MEAVKLLRAASILAALACLALGATVVRPRAAVMVLRQEATAAAAAGGEEAALRAKLAADIANGTVVASAGEPGAATATNPAAPVCPPADCPPPPECKGEGSAAAELQQCPPPPPAPECACEACNGSDSGSAVPAAKPAAMPAAKPAAQTRAFPSWRDSPHAAETGYRPGLTVQQLQRGLVSMGAMARPRRAMAKLLAGEPISVGIIGGSITWGQGSSARGEKDWASRVFAWIRETFPGANHTLVNGAIPASPSSYYALCSSWHVPPDADLVINEFNVNDGDGVPMALAHERLVRKLLGMPNRPTVAEMVFYRFPDDIAKPEPSHYRYHGDDQVAALAQYYHTPWFAVRSLVWDYLQETAMPNVTRSENMRQLWYSKVDVDHPSDTGHGWMADLVIYWMQRVLDDLVRHPLGEEDERDAQAPLSVPMYRGNFEGRTNACLMGALVRDLATKTDGFEWVNEGTEQKPKWGYVSTVPGSELHLTINTKVLDGMGPDDQVTLAVGFLKSYEHMGTWEMTCEAGCACEPLKRDGHHEKQESQMFHAMVGVSAADECQLRFTVLNETESGEHKFKLIGLVISETQGFSFTDDMEDRATAVAYQTEPGSQGATYAEGGLRRQRRAIR